MLWYWGFRVRKVSPAGVMISKGLLGSNLTTTKIAMPLAFLMWINGIALFFGLPEYFRQGPLQHPCFYRSIMRRKIILVSPAAHLFDEMQIWHAASDCANLVAAVVFRHRGNPKLFPGLTLQSQLEISLV